MIELTPDVRREFERLHKRLDEIEENFGHDWNAMADLVADLIHALYCPDLYCPDLYCPDCEGNANHERTLCQCSCHEDEAGDKPGLVSPRGVHERAMELWVNEGAPGDELPEGRHYRRALAELEGEGMKGFAERVKKLARSYPSHLFDMAVDTVVADTRRRGG